MAGQSRFVGQEWRWCTPEHVRMVHNNPRYAAEGYEARYLYATPQPEVAQDAQRWRAVAHDLSIHGIAVVSIDDYGACEMLTGTEANEAIDAALSATTPSTQTKE